MVKPIAACSRQDGVGIAVLAVALGVVLAGCSGYGRTVPTRDDSGAIVKEAETNPFALIVGDCLGEPDPNGSGEISSLTVIPCSDPHAFEAYAAMDLPDGGYPGEAKVTAAADEFCVDGFESFVGSAYDGSDLAIQYEYPSDTNWTWKEDRQVMCLVGPADAAPVTGSLKNTAR